MTDTQNDRVLAYLKRGESIDPLTAIKALGVYRLGARIFDLRQAGHKIERDLIPVKNRFGEVSRVALYRLAR